MDYESLKDLERTAIVALGAGDAAAARQAALAMLLGNTDLEASYYGSVVHDANQLLGLAALMDDDVSAAEEYLRAAGQTRTSPVLRSFGPKMYLAQKLLARGRRDVVLEYLDAVGRFWPNRVHLDTPFFRHSTAAQVAEYDSWKAAIYAGEQPQLNGAHEELPKLRSKAGRTTWDERIVILMKDLVAEETFVAVSRSGEHRTISVKVCKPIVGEGRVIYCASVVEGLDDEDEVMPAAGANALQALGFAFTHPWQRLRRAISSGLKLYNHEDADRGAFDEPLTESDLDTHFGITLP